LHLSKRSTSLIILLTILLTNLIGSCLLSNKLTATAAGTPTVKVDPELIEYHDNAVGQEFTVAIRIIDVADLYVFNITLRWNTTVLEYEHHSVCVPRDTYPDGVLWNPVFKISDELNQAAGTYCAAYTSLPPAPSFTGSGTAFTITFKVKYHPRAPEPTINTKLELYETELAQFGGNPLIPHNRENGTVVLYAIPLTEVKVYPETTEYTLNATGQQFTAAVGIANVTNLYQLNIHFTWNTTLLEHVSHSLSIPKNTYDDGVLWNPISEVKDEINTTAGTYQIAYSSSHPAPSFNGSGTVFTITFQVRHHPVEPEPTAITKLKISEAELYEADATEIPCTKEDGTVILHQIPKQTLSIEPAFITFGNSSGDEIPIPGTQFSVAVEIHDITDLYGFDLDFRWNTTYLQYISHVVCIPKNTYPEGVLWKPVTTLADEINTADGIYHLASYSGDPAPSFNGSGTIFTMTFQIKKQTYAFQTGTLAIEPVDVMLDFISADFAEKGGTPITLNIKSGTVRIWERAFEMPPNPMLKVMPELVEKLPLNSNFDINIWIIGLNSSYDIASFNITLNYNSTLIEATSLTKGAWSESYAQSTIEELNLIDNANGKVTYALELVPPREPDPPAIGMLFTVSFRVIYESLDYPPPSTELTLSPTNITDRIFGNILHIRQNGTYTANRPLPKAEFTWSPRSYYLFIGQTVTFNASESYHPLGGAIISYKWDFGDGTMEEITSSAITSHIYSSLGTAKVVLNVTDYGGFWDSTSITLYIVESPPNPYVAVEPTLNKFGPYPPQVIGHSFNVSIYIENLDTAWNLNYVTLSLSYNRTLVDIVDDADSVTISSLWKGPNNIAITRSEEATAKLTCTVQNSTVIPSGKELVITIEFTIMYQGTYPTVDTGTITLDQVGLTGTLGEIPVEKLVNAQIVIRGLSQPLKAQFTYSPSSPDVNETVTFNASDSTPQDRIANYTWDFDDGNITTANNSILTHQFPERKTYTVTLTVTDIEGLNNTNSETIAVGKAPTDLTPYILAAVAVVIIAIVVIYLVKVRKPTKDQKSTNSSR
jgi:PKD repeat protein